MALRQQQDIPARFRLCDDGLISVLYAPVDYINREARVVVLGITPGWHQAQLAFETGIAMRGVPEDVEGREIKERSAFAGPMRQNLITMLQRLAIHEILDIKLRSGFWIFGPRSDGALMPESRLHCDCGAHST